MVLVYNSDIKQNPRCHYANSVIYSLPGTGTYVVIDISHKKPWLNVILLVASALLLYIAYNGNPTAVIRDDDCRPNIMKMYLLDFGDSELITIL
jgi:hypothetical protein